MNKECNDLYKNLRKDSRVLPKYILDCKKSKSPNSQPCNGARGVIKILDDFFKRFESCLK